MKLRIEVDSETYFLDLRKNCDLTEYQLSGSGAQSGTASVVEVTPDVFSVLIGQRSFTVHVAPHGDDLETCTEDGQRRLISVADARDRSGKAGKTTAEGPIEIRGQMPGKVVKILVEKGAAVKSGQGLLVVEAMKMQNEVKSPKDGIVTKILATEGSAVVAGEPLLVVE